MTYFTELQKSMTYLGAQPDTVFIGQQCREEGNAMFATLSGVPMEKRIEFPVAEDMQMGMAIGLALTGKTVISIYPRFDFLLLAMNQLVNHLYKLPDFTHGQYKAKVIVRVGIGSISPMYPGVQHCSDYTEGLRKMLNSKDIWSLKYPSQILDSYKAVYSYDNPSIMIEDMNLYGK